MESIIKDNILKLEEGKELDFIMKYLNEQEELFPYPKNNPIREYNWWIERIKRIIWQSQADLEIMKIWEKTRKE